MKNFPRFPFLILVFFVLVGFKAIPQRWDIGREDPTLWIRVCENSVVVEENDADAGDPLAAIESPTVTQIIQTIIDDYNNISPSFLRLAVYPADPQNPGAPLPGDSAFTEERAKNRTVDVCFGDLGAGAGLSGAWAKLSYKDGFVSGCEVRVRMSSTRNVKFLTHILTHELGHCFGLLHPQESSNSVMSYFYPDPFMRLQADDSAGITFQYPVRKSYGEEKYTWGLSSCAPSS